jgi:hypothetical protein
MHYQSLSVHGGEGGHDTSERGRYHEGSPHIVVAIGMYGLVKAKPVDAEKCDQCRQRKEARPLRKPKGDRPKHHLDSDRRQQLNHDFHFEKGRVD